MSHVLDYKVSTAYDQMLMSLLTLLLYFVQDVSAQGIEHMEECRVFTNW